MSFSLFADTNNDGAYETTLVNNQNPFDMGLANTYTFSSVTANRFHAIFTGNNTQFSGPLIVELDAIGSVAAPELGSTLLLVLGLLGMVGIVRRRRN